jgi:soluble lytic murein transglycosylase-like protein
MRRRLLALLVIATISGLAAAGVSGARSPKAAAAPARIPALPPVTQISATRRAWHAAACPIPAAWRTAFERASTDVGLPLAMLVAVAQFESRFQPAAHSEAGATGLMQVMPATARALQLTADEPGSNVLAGARFLRKMLDQFRSSDLALAAYNAGPTAVERAGGAPSSVTLAYVENVTSLWRELNGCT